MTQTEQRVAQHLQALLAAWAKMSDDEKKEAVETTLSRLPANP